MEERKEVIVIEDDDGDDYEGRPIIRVMYECPRCYASLIQYEDECPKCEQKLKWV